MTETKMKRREVWYEEGKDLTDLVIRDGDILIERKRKERELVLDSNPVTIKTCKKEADETIAVIFRRKDDGRDYSTIYHSKMDESNEYSQLNEKLREIGK